LLQALQSCFLRFEASRQQGQGIRSDGKPKSCSSWWLLGFAKNDSPTGGWVSWDDFVRIGLKKSTRFEAINQFLYRFPWASPFLGGRHLGFLYPRRRNGVLPLGSMFTILYPGTCAEHMLNLPLGK
jgi:hypothetical protein